MLDLPPELIDQILYYLTSRQIKICLDAHPFFKVLSTKKAMDMLWRTDARKACNIELKLLARMIDQFVKERKEGVHG